MVKTIRPNFPLDKIIALDPAGPIFEYNDSNLRQDPSLRLNNGDATIVEAIHTSTAFLGYKDPLGDYDFYINGGKTQPGCKKSLDFGSCCHSKVVKMFDYIHNNDVSCSSTWKCNIDDGSTLQDISEENKDKLKSASCYNHPNVELGALDPDTSKSKGAYWVDISKDSKTCSIPVTTI